MSLKKQEITGPVNFNIFTVLKKANNTNLKDIDKVNKYIKYLELWISRLGIKNVSKEVINTLNMLQKKKMNLQKDLFYYAKDPITLDTYEFNEWLNMSPDNIIITLNEKNVTLKDREFFALKKSYFESPLINTILNKCIISNNQLMVKETYEKKTDYINIGYFLNKQIVLNLKNIKFNKNKIYIIDLLDENLFINKQFLELSNIGLKKDLTFKQFLKDKNTTTRHVKDIKMSFNKSKKVTKKNIPHKKEVYFEQLLLKALENYSFQWDAPINHYLRFGANYFLTPTFIKYYKRYGSTIELAKKAIIEKINHIDKAFLEAAPRNENDTKSYWRGMKNSFENFNNIGDKISVNNFLSITESFGIARTFSNIQNGSTCCLYKINISKGIPIIDMITSTKYKNEKETLLPRNLILELKSIENLPYPFASKKPLYNIPIYVIEVTTNNLEQFKINTGCKTFFEGTLQPYKISSLENSIKKHDQFNNKTNLSIPKSDLKDKLDTDNFLSPLSSESSIKSSKSSIKSSKSSIKSSLSSASKQSINNNKTKKVICSSEDDIYKSKFSTTILLKGKRCPWGYLYKKSLKMCRLCKISKAEKDLLRRKTYKNVKGLPRCPSGLRRSKITGKCEKK